MNIGVYFEVGGFNPYTRFCCEWGMYNDGTRSTIEALWTYEIATEKVLWRSVKKGYITKEEADEFSEMLFEQLNTDNIPGFRLSHLDEKMQAEDID